VNETLLKFLSVLIPHVTITAVFVGLLLRALWRYERRADALLAKYDEWDAESERTFAQIRDEVLASIRAQVDTAIAEMATRSGNPVRIPETSSNGVHPPTADPSTDAPTPRPELTNRSV